MAAMRCMLFELLYSFTLLTILNLIKFNKLIKCCCERSLIEGCRPLLTGKGYHRYTFSKVARQHC